MIYLQKIEIAFLEDCCGIMLYQIHLESPENCHFHIFAAILSNGVVGHLFDCPHFQSILTELD